MRRDQAGFTLVEFSFASLATMIMLAATFTLMNMVFTSNSGMGEMMGTQQNVRVAINQMARDITMAGTGLPSGTVALPNGLNSSPIVRPGMSSFSSAERELEVSNGAVPIVSPGNGSGPTVSIDTDALTIFTVDQETPTWTTLAYAGFFDHYEVTFSAAVNAGTYKLAAGDLLLFYNANGSVLNCVTSIDNTNTAKALFGSSDAMGVNQPTAAAGNLGSLVNADGTFPPTTAIKVKLINYFIDNSNTAHPKLIRAVNAETPQEIARDIDNLQFYFDLFDYDTNVATNNQDHTDNPNQIRSVLISITGRSSERMKRSNDYYHFSLVSKISVRNSTFRNRYNGS